MPELKDSVTTSDHQEIYEQQGYWTGETLVDRLLYHESTRGSEVAVIEGVTNKRITYRKLAQQARRLAAHLNSKGVVQGDVVAVQMPNTVDGAVAYCGALMCGAVVIPLITHYRAQELVHILSVSTAKAIITPVNHRSFDFVPMVAELQERVPTLESHVVGDDLHRMREQTHGFDLPQEPAVARSVSEIVFTSGTESIPKAVMHTEETTNCAVRLAHEFLGLDESDVVWMPSPVGHSTGLNYGLRLAIYHGIPIVLQDKWSPSDAFDIIDSYKCTYTLAAATFLSDLTAECERRKATLPSMRFFSCGGAPVAPELVDSAGEAGIGVLRLYGSTELLVASWVPPSASIDQRRSTDGVVMRGVELRALTSSGDLVGEGEGELYGRGPTASVGFLGDPERTAATYSPDGWIRTGDLGIISNSFVNIQGRLKEIIIRGGVNIAPRELEDLLLEMPSVKSVAVVGLPDDRLGEVACAFVVPTDEGDVSLEGICAFLEERGVARYKFPEMLQTLDVLPTTASGKIQKQSLKESYGGVS